MKKRLNSIFYSPNVRPSFKAEEYCLQATFTTRIAYNDYEMFERIFERMIISSSTGNFIKITFDDIFLNLFYILIEFRECKNCWQNPNNIKVKIIYQNNLINSNGMNYYSILFMVFLKQQITGEIVAAKVIDEPDFKENITRLKSKLVSRFNKCQNKNNNLRNYKVYDDDEELLRETENYLPIYLSQSILFEDKDVITEEIKNSCKLNDKLIDESFEIEYWGQSERIKDSTVNKT